METATRLKSALDPRSHTSAPFFERNGARDTLLKSRKASSPFFNHRNVQTKLTIGRRGDKFEREADSIAENVVQKKAVGNVTQTASQTDQVSRTTSSLERNLAGSKGRGAPLDDRTRAGMEDKFGVDFRGVKIHTDSDAVRMNKSLGAQAFANGNDIYFDSGKYSPRSKGGIRLLAHELTHVVQQGASSSGHVQKNGPDTDPDLYLNGQNYWFNSIGQARNAATLKLSELSLNGTGHYRIEHHPLPVRGLPHFHVYNTTSKKDSHRGHFFYRTGRRRRQYKVDWRSVYKVVVALGLSLALIAVIIAAVLDPEPASKLALAGLSVAMIGMILSSLEGDSDDNAT